MSTPTLPGWVRHLAAWLLPAADAEFILGDLEELFQKRVGRIGVAAARRRYVRDALGSVIARTRLVRWWTRRRSGGRNGSTPDGGPRRVRSGLPDVLSDLRIVIRSLMREKSLAAVIVLTMGGAIGTNTAVFSVVEGVLLRPFDYPEPERLVRPYISRRSGEAFVPRENFGTGHYFLFQDRMRSFEELGAYTLPTASSLGGDGPAAGVMMTMMTPSAFRAVGVEPWIGRLPTDEEVRGGAQTVILDHGFWVDRYGSDPSVLGRVVSFHGQPSTIIGVMPPEFDFPNPEIRAWGSLPLHTYAGPPENSWLRLVGRLVPGVTGEAAAMEMSLLVPLLAEAGLDSAWVTRTFDNGVEMHPLRDEVVGAARAPIEVLFWASIAVLLVACGNITNLLLARAEGRTREHALRRALGSDRTSLIRLVLTESVLLGLAGGVLGVFLAYLGTRFLVTWPAAQGVPRLHEVEVNRAVLLFTFSVSLGASLIAGLIPALRAGSSRALTALRDGGRTRTEGRSQHRVRSMLVVSQIALALGLAVGAGLLVRSHRAMAAVDAGFEPDGLLSMPVTFPASDYPDIESRAMAMDELRTAVLDLPGVERVTSSVFLPLTRPMVSVNAEALDPPMADVSPTVMVVPQRVLPGYFDMMGIPILEGRDLTEDAHREKLPVVIVSRGLAEHFWPGESALGKELDARGAPARIIGVVDDVIHSADIGAPARPTIYKPIVDAEQGLTVFGGYLVIRSSRSPSELEQEIRTVGARVAPAIPVEDLHPMSDLADRAMARTTFTMTLLLIASSIAVFLGMVGVYAVLSYVAQRRTAEIGIRMALGASRDRIRRELVGRGLSLAGTGVAVGVALAVVGGRTMESILFGVAPVDVPTLIVVTTLLLGIAAVASLVPAIRAARTSPAVTIRMD